MDEVVPTPAKQQPSQWRDNAMLTALLGALGIVLTLTWAKLDAHSEQIAGIREALGRQTGTFEGMREDIAELKEASKAERADREEMLRILRKLDKP